VKRQDFKLSASLRFLALVAGMLLVFGGCGSLMLGAFDEVQTRSKDPLVNPGILFHHVTHYLGDLWGVVTSFTNHVGIPFHDYFLFGVGLTIAFCFLAMPLAIVIGFVLALMSRSRLRIVRVPARAYVEFFRNTPLLVQLLAIYWALVFLPDWFLNAFTAGVATLVLNYAAYECENLRAGIEALDRGQSEAASALGLSQPETLRLVVVPQIIPVVLPTVINDLIYMYKDSSILSLITVQELTSQTFRLSRGFEFLSWQFFLVASLIYLALSLPFGRLARWTETRLRGVGFAPKRDLSQTAIQVLLAAMVAGWVCDVLTLGPSLGNAAFALGQVLVAALLSVALIVFMFCTLGLIVYAVGTPFAVLRRQRLPSPEPADAIVLTALSK
jgi:His/Glu/Gln/Arg/opine family amino acid ABC transporter permease subunit